MKKVENYMEKMKKKIYNFVNMAFTCYKITSICARILADAKYILSFTK